MVIRGADGNLYWQDPSTGELTPYTGPAAGSVEPKDVAPVDLGGSPPPAAPTGSSNPYGIPDDVWNNIDPAQQGSLVRDVALVGGWDKYVAARQAAAADAQQKADLALQLQQKQLGISGGTLGVSQARLAFDQQQAAAAAALKGQQFKDQLDFEKQKWGDQQGATQTQEAEKQREFNQQLDFNRGKELLSIGSRPETLLRYLYAIRGLQAPQGNFGVSALPGFGGAASTGATGAPAITGAANPGISAPPPAGSLTLGGDFAGTKVSPIGGGHYGIPGNGAPTLVGPGTTSMSIPGVKGATQAATMGDAQAALAAVPRAQRTTDEAAGAAANNAKVGQPGGRLFGYGPTGQALFFKDGGVIPEPVIGRGLMSGQLYVLNEDPSKPETVVPEGKTVAEAKQERHAVNDYKKGGTIGHSPKKIQAPAPDAMARMNQQMAAMNNSLKLPVRGADVPGVGMGQNGMGMGAGYAYARGGDIGFDVPVPGQAYPGEPSMNRLGTRGVDQAQLVAGPHLGGPGINKYNDRPTALPNTYALGGALGYDPNQPRYGGANAGVFNPGALPSLANSAELSPGVPNLPQLSAATGGTSLIPSAQRWGSLLPSEQSAYKGVLQDQFGVDPGDIESITKRLSPSALSTYTPLGRVLRGLSESTYGQGEKS